MMQLTAYLDMHTDKWQVYDTDMDTGYNNSLESS